MSAPDEEIPARLWGGPESAMRRTAEVPCEGTSAVFYTHRNELIDSYAEIES